MQPLQPDERLDDWLQQMRTNTLKDIPLLESKIEGLNEEVEAAKVKSHSHFILFTIFLLPQTSVQTEVNAVRALLTTHHRLMSDIRSILKSLAKV